MTFLGASSSCLRATRLRPALRAAPRAAMSTTPRRLANQDYGSTDSSPKAAKEQPSSSATRSKEHPGAPAPDVGQNKESSTSSSKADQKQQGESNSSSGSSSSSSSSSNKDKAVKDARPKILDESAPAEINEDVKQHNREMEQRHDRADTRLANDDVEKDKMPPGFWSGQGGRMGG